MKIILEVSPHVKTKYNYPDLEVKTKICEDLRGGESFFFVAASGQHSTRDIEILLECIDRLTQRENTCSSS